MGASDAGLEGYTYWNDFNSKFTMQEWKTYFGSANGGNDLTKDLAVFRVTSTAEGLLYFSASTSTTPAGYLCKIQGTNDVHTDNDDSVNGNTAYTLMIKGGQIQFLLQYCIRGLKIHNIVAKNVFEIYVLW